MGRRFLIGWWVKRAAVRTGLTHPELDLSVLCAVLDEEAVLFLLPVGGDVVHACIMDSEN